MRGSPAALSFDDIRKCRCLRYIYMRGEKEHRGRKDAKP